MWFCYKSRKHFNLTKSRAKSGTLYVEIFYVYINHETGLQMSLLNFICNTSVEHVLYAGVMPYFAFFSLYVEALSLCLYNALSFCLLFLMWCYM